MLSVIQKTPKKLFTLLLIINYSTLHVFAIATELGSTTYMSVLNIFHEEGLENSSFITQTQQHFR